MGKRGDLKFDCQSERRKKYYRDRHREIMDELLLDVEEQEEDVHDILRAMNIHIEEENAT